MIINRDCSVEGAHWRVFPPARIFWIPHHTGSPRTTMRGPEREGEAFICRYSWIPHQVRNDETAGSRKVPLVGIAFARISRPGIPGFRIKCGMTERAGSREGPLVGIAFAGISGYRVVHRVTPHSDAGSRKVPLVGIAFADIPGFRIKCGMTGRVFLDTASQRSMTWSTAV